MGSQKFMVEGGVVALGRGEFCREKGQRPPVASGQLLKYGTNVGIGDISGGTTGQKAWDGLGRWPGTARFWPP